MGLFLTVLLILLFWKVIGPLCRIAFAYTLGITLFSKRKNLRTAGEWAIVTGATDGLGKCYAEKLAKDGLKIMLISRNQEKLENVAKSIECRYSVETKIIVADFTKTDIYEQIAKEINALNSIACLVNNVGMSYPYFAEYNDGDFLDMEFIKGLSACNMNSVACLTRIVLPKLLKQDSQGSAIINVSSVAGLMPCPFLTLYGASKAFVVNFTEALANELSGKNGIHLQCVTPHFVATSMSNIKRTSLFVPSPDTFVSSALDMLGVERTTFGYLPHAILVFGLMFLPNFLVANHMKSIMMKQRRKRN